jgi:2-deoxy-D-gluconate 3-dehydrogenase
MFDLTGLTAAVTGASRGIGRAIAAGLLHAGADVVTLQRGNPAPQLADIAEAHGRRVTHQSVDLASPKSTSDAVEQVLGRQSVDILVNNAGAQIRGDSVDFAMSDLDTLLDVNLRAVFALCQQFGAPMLDRGRGKIINLASLLSFQGGVGVAGYAASKGAVAQLTKALCNEWASYGINVNAIAPGYLETDMTEALSVDPVRNEQISVRIPAGRWGRPDDVVGPVVFLASSASDYVHGIVMPVDGGWMAR